MAQSQPPKIVLREFCLKTSGADAKMKICLDSPLIVIRSSSVLGGNKDKFSGRLLIRSSLSKEALAMRLGCKIEEVEEVIV